MRLGGLVAVLTFSFGALACASSGVHFSGRAEPSLARPGALRDLEVLPYGYQRIGRVSARCSLIEGERPRNGARLVDVDCTESRLMAAIRERAAEVGGEALVGTRCRSRIRSQNDDSVTLALSCEASVARPSDDTLAHRPLLGEVLAEDDPARAAEAWQIRVFFTPGPGSPERPPRRPEGVREVPLLPLADVRLGDLTTSCKCGCTQEGARRGLLAAAGRYGATDVVDLRCSALGHGWTCTGTAAAYEVDPELDPRAR